MFISSASDEPEHDVSVTHTGHTRGRAPSELGPPSGRYRRRALLGIPVAAAALLLLSGCSAGASTGPTGGGGATADSTAQLPQGSDPVELDPADFSADITNPFWPMTPGTRWTYREVDGAGGVLDIVVTATSETKKVANGITARVVRDTVYRDGAVVEDTIDWYAQHRDGTVWYLGEDTAEFEGGVAVSTSGSFEAGKDGALAGIAIPGDPRPGQQYRQEYFAGEAEDNGAVLSVDEIVTSAYGSFSGALLTRDTITIEPDVSEYKLYAPGVGPVLILDVAAGTGAREELMNVTTVPPGTGTGPLGQPD